VNEKIPLEILLQKGIINQEQLTRAQEEVIRTGISLEKALEKLGFISEVNVAQAVADSLGVPFLDLSDYLIDPEVIKLIPEAVAKKYMAVPLFKIGESLTIAMADPRNVEAIDDIRMKSRVDTIDPVLSPRSMIQHVIEQYYGAQGSIQELTLGLTKEKLEEQIKNAATSGLIAEETSVVKLMNLIIMEAVKGRASDIHVEPEEDKLRIRYRIDGVLHEAQILAKHLQSVLTSRIKVMAGMDIAESRNPQDGRIKLKMEHKQLDLRVSAFPTVHGENIVIRILDKSSVLWGLEELGFSEKDLRDFTKIIHKPNGIVLVTGPTGSGKTTTLYAALSSINSPERNIITIEDPVEYEMPLIRQTQVNPRAGLTFANGLRSILRQDPDVIMVGEIRDRETAEVAIQASLTGHLVFSTLHTNDAASALTRLLDMGIESFLVASSVVAILAQRLVRVICPSCKETYSPSETVLRELRLPESFALYRGKGCAKCDHRGYNGRIGIFELLVISDELKNMVTGRMSSAQIKKKAVEIGMRVLFDDGIEKVKQGITTVEELLRVTEEI
jgi:type IV pilus assembly protein PilB